MSLFQYAVLQAVPQVQRGESVNVGVVLYSQDAAFLDARTHVDADRLRALHRDIDLTAVEQALDAVCRACRGEGPAGSEPLRVRFGWLTAPRSTIVRAGPVHLGKAEDLRVELERLHTALVL